MTKICLESIGEINSDFNNPNDLIFACEKGLKTKTYSKIILDKKYEKGLEGLSEFSHIFVLYFLDKAKKIELLTHPGPPSISLPKVGFLASRSQYRPNHIALRLVKLNKIEGNVLDAINGSKVLDIKPYVSGFDRLSEFKTAYWYDWLNK